VAGGYLDNLISSFGGIQEGPDPSRLEGLAELARQRLAEVDPEPEELLHHVERMRGRIRELYRDRQGNFEGRRSQLDEAMISLLETNITLCNTIDEALGCFAEAYSNQVKDDAALALDGYEQAVRDFFQSCDQIAARARSEQPLCPRCASLGPEPICPKCQVDRLTPDPDFAEEEFEQTAVNEEFAAVFHAYSAILEGRGTLAELTQALQPLEFTLLEAQALVEQTAEESPDDVAIQELLQSIQRGLEGVERMHSVEQNRSTRELNLGWSQVFRSASVLSQLLPALSGSGQEDDEDNHEDEE
jgi:hypothetical protein